MDDQAGWSSAQLLATPPPSGLTEEQTITVGGRQYWECGHTGWHLMLGWLSGPETLMRVSDNRDHYWDVTEHTPTGIKTGRQPMAPDDRREIEDDQNAYLDYAGLPSDRPHGYRWFQVLPDGLTVEDVHAAANEAIDTAGLTESRYISKAVPHMRTALLRLYS